MGREARLRGSYEDRVAQSIERQEADEERQEQERLEYERSLTPEQRKRRFERQMAMAQMYGMVAGMLYRNR